MSLSSIFRSFGDPDAAGNARWGEPTLRLAQNSRFSAQSYPRLGRGHLAQMGQTALEELGYIATFELVSFHDGHQQGRANASSHHLITNAIDNFPLNHGLILSCT